MGKKVEDSEDGNSEYESKYKGCRDCSLGFDCCCWSSSCHLCCGCLPAINQSTGTKLMYSMYLLFFTALATMINSSGFIDLLKEGDIWEKFCAFIDDDFDETDPNSVKGCEQLLGTTGVYLVYLSLAIFFIIMAALTSNLRHSRQFRGKIHNGFWFWKMAIILGVFIGLYIGLAYNGSNTRFLEVWKWIALVFGTFFIFWQMTVFVNFAYDWGKTWHGAAQRSESKAGKCCWFFSIWFFASILMIITAAAYFCLYFSFTISPSGVEKGPCEINKWFIIGSGAAGLLVIFMALVPCGNKAPTRTPSTGILQAALVATYMMYLTFSAINAQQTINVLDYNTTENTNTTVGAECTERCFSVPQSFALWAIGISNDNINVIDLIESINLECSASAETTNTLSTVFNYIAIVLTLFLTIYSAMNSSGVTANADAEKPPMFCCCYSWDYDTLKGADMQGQDVIEDDYDRLTYRYWAFHLIYATASMYLMMTITNWFTPAASLEESFKNDDSTTFWIKAGTAGVITIIYIGALIAPLFCPKSWFSHQLDGHAGEADNVVAVSELDFDDSGNGAKNPYNEKDHKLTTVTKQPEKSKRAESPLVINPYADAEF